MFKTGVDINGNEIYSDNNPEYIQVTTDKDGKIINCINPDGTKSFKVGMDAEKINIGGNEYYVSETPEWIRVITDGDGKIIAGVRNNGSTYIAELEGIDIDTIKQEIREYVEDITQNIKKINDTFEIINDVEDRNEMTLDSSSKIISYREDDGTLVENIGIETPFLKVGKIDAPGLHQVVITESKDTIYVERPKCGEIWFEGELPTDRSDARTPTWLTMTFKNSGVTQFMCKCTLAIQGHGSAMYNKKGYTLEPYNDKDKSINIKFGDMIEIDSFHLKAYATDSLHCRDMGNFRIWRKIIQYLGYPYSKYNNIPFELSTDYNKNIDNTADAKYAPDGFPCICYLNNEFLGIYTLKLKKSRQNYAMEKSVKTEIFLDAIHYQGCLSSPFDPYGWDLKNPKLKNYEEGGDIPDQDVLNSINRLFDFTSSWRASDPSTIDGYEDYIVLPHWLAFVILEELVFSEDSNGNNINVVTWDNTHWSIIPYDTDLSYGLHAAASNINNLLYTKEEMQTHFVGYGDIWPRFRSLFNTQLRELWTNLRKDGIITFETVFNEYKNQCDSIPRDAYAADYKKWGTIWSNGIPSMEHLAENIEARIEWLDEQWLIND